jgi:hypothetical protein
MKFVITIRAVPMPAPTIYTKLVSNFRNASTKNSSVIRSMRIVATVGLSLVNPCEYFRVTKPMLSKSNPKRR